MEIRNNAENLKNLLSVNPASSANAQQVQSGKTPQQGGASGLTGDQATFSNLGQEVSLAARSTDVRTEKVAAIQAALNSGTYSVAPKAVAHRVVDSLLSGNVPKGSTVTSSTVSAPSRADTDGDTDGSSSVSSGS
ncbi:MAG: flagellar biosynthesis anti-sigma factor FlgM [Acidobacteriota bacterium]|nr:flagellar biosynthesis anti-sigma factor FlgM [Acidobacteriota bacterium]